MNICFCWKGQTNISGNRVFGPSYYLFLLFSPFSPLYYFFYISISFVDPGLNFTRTVLALPGAPNAQYSIDSSAIRFQIEHFSLHIPRFKFTRKRDIKMCCDTLLPKCMTSNRKLTIRVYVYKAQTGMEEVKWSIDVREPNLFLDFTEMLLLFRMCSSQKKNICMKIAKSNDQ